MRIKFALLILISLCTSKTEVQAQSHHVRQNAPSPRSVVLTRVRGWESQLVQGNPNLARYYWEPMMRRTINTTATTGHQAVRALMPVAKMRRERIRNSGTENFSNQNSEVRSVSLLSCRRAQQVGSGADTDTILSYCSNANSAAKSAGKSAPHSVAIENSAQLGVSAHLVNAGHTVAVMQNAGLEAHQLSLTSGLRN